MERLTAKYQTRNPYELCEALGIRISVKELGADICAYYYYYSRVHNILINSHASDDMRRILLAHELGHARLHKHIAILKGFREMDIFDMVQPTEYEANVFAAELLIADSSLLDLLNGDSASFYQVVSQLCLPADLVDLKLRALKCKGYHVEPLYIANGEFLRNII